MVATIAHRGPDDEALHCEPGAALGFRRLSIVDLEGGRQPLCNEDETVWLVFNGEIYNHDALRADLTRLGHRFRSRSDSEVIVHAYEEWGEACAERLRGIFAFAIWDRTRRRLFLGRDHSGIKPLYFAWAGDDFLFASEAKAILASGKIERRLDVIGASRLSMSEDDIQATPFAGVSQLGPGRSLLVDARGQTSRRYWQYRPADEIGPARAADVIEAFRERLVETVGMQMVADVPVAAYLSGGLDSAAIVACAHRIGHRLRSYTTASRDFEDERYTRLLLDHLGMEGKLVEHALPEDLTDVVRTVAWMAEGPFDLGFVARYCLSRAVREDGVKVILTGQGIDEILTGYFPNTASFVRGVRRRAVWNGVPFWWQGPVFGDRVMEEILARRAPEAPRGLPDVPLVARELAWWHGTLHGYLLRFEDRMGMANGVEVRVPFLDHELLELVACIPDPLRRELFSEKRLLREAARPWLPQAIADRPKESGFNASLTPLSRMALARGGTLARLLEREEIERRGYFEWDHCATRRDANDFQALDAILIVQLLDDLFVSSFPATSFHAPLPIELRCFDSSVASGIEPMDEASTYRANDVPRLHVDVIGFELRVAAGAQSIAEDDDHRVVFAQGTARGTRPLTISADLLHILRLVDGRRTCEEIHAALREIAELELSDLLAALSTLRAQGALAYDLRRSPDGH
jgi:asparagine synthase (glutamine-hydrolysing)